MYFNSFCLSLHCKVNQQCPLLVVQKDKTLNSLDGHPAETQGGYVPCWSNPSGVMFLYMLRLDKALYRCCIKDAEAFKALALFVYIKQHKPCSVFPDYTLEKMSKFCVLSKNTTRKRIKKLESMGLVCRVGRYGQHMLFRRARRKRANVDVGNIRYDNIRDIELALRSLFICEIQRSKDWLGQRVFEAYGSDERISYKRVKRSLKICKKRGITEFTDNGISWNTISKRLNCSLSTVSNVLKFGEREGFFRIHRHCVELIGESAEIVKYSDERGLFVTKSGRVFKVSANTYSLPSIVLQTN